MEQTDCIATQYWICSTGTDRIYSYIVLAGTDCTATQYWTCSPGLAVERMYSYTIITGLIALELRECICIATHVGLVIMEQRECNSYTI